MKKTIALLLTGILTATAFANITLPKIFGDNMVLQRSKPISIWGWAAPNEKVAVQFHNQTKNTTADKDGRWQLLLAAETAGGPFQLTAKGSNEVVIKNILVGEVWVCSGQSNMEMTIAGWGEINNFKEEIAAADYPLIRHIKVPTTVSTSLKDDISGGDWQVCSPANAGRFSATAYFFARSLYNKLKVPIGLINTSWGGTQSEAWTSEQAFAKSPEMKYVATAMQASSFEKSVQERSGKMLKNIVQLQGSFDSAANTSDWQNIDFDDSKWPVMKVPGVWEDQGLPGLDGTVWYRKTVTIGDASAGKAAVLELGAIDDNDVTYVNGIQVGSTDSYNALRKYPIAAGILKAGKNTIAIKIGDTGGGGGMYSEAAAITLNMGDSALPLAGDWAIRVAAIKPGSSAPGPNDYPSLLFNAMLNPLIKYTIKGAIWYQGESNESRAYQYRIAFPLMINDWRTHFKQGNFPFYFVQLATFGSAGQNSSNGSNWGELRESQAMALALPNTGMIVATDIGNPIDIHPKNKQDVGKRLAALALHNDYNVPGEYASPLYKANTITGNKATIAFTHTGSGLLVKSDDKIIKGFEIAGADKKFYPARATIVGDKIIVSANEVAQPASVRYNWANDASAGNVFNKEGFPMAPFRTDSWDGVTIREKYKVGL